MLEENKKNYYAIIPANVRYDINLCPNAKLLYGEITALCNEKGFCWASNSYFAELYSVSTVSVSRWISLLEQLGYIKVDLIYKENSKEIKCRHIRIVNNFDITPNNTTGGSNNKSTNSTKEKYTDEIKEIIDFLNEKTSSRYRYNTESTNKLIRSKLNNGFTVNDFKYIISNKTNEWGGTDFEQYLRPSTLFGNKFEQYLNQSPYKTKFNSLNISQQTVPTTQNNNTNEEKYLTNDDGNLIVF